jgi:HlyD family secretion protein
MRVAGPEEGRNDDDIARVATANSCHCGRVAVAGGGPRRLAVTTEFSGAVIASGQLVVDSNVKKVQHPTGGVVGELHVRDGARVAAEDIVVRLDDTQTRANLGS